MKGYKTSKDYKRLKELLDKGYDIVILCVLDTTKILFSDIATKVPPIPGGVDGCWYSIGAWSYFPTVNKESFEEKCKSIESGSMSFIMPDYD